MYVVPRVQERTAGESKLTMKQNIEYLRQLRSLYVFKFGATACVCLPLLLIVVACAILAKLLALAM